MTKQAIEITGNDVPRFQRRREVLNKRARAVAKSAVTWSKEACSVENLKRKVPITTWLPTYRASFLINDIIAGLTVALIVVPQSLALAQIADLPPQYGLYTGFMSCFVYCILGSSKDVTLGPTAVMAILALQFGETPIKGNATYIVILTLMTGVVQVAIGIFNLGFAVNFISHPVLSAFISAAALLISWGQIKKMSGIRKLPRTFHTSVYELFRRITETIYWDVILGVSCVVILIVLKKIKEVGDKKKKSFDNKKGTSRLVKLGLSIVWILTTSRNAIIVLATAGMSAGLLAANNGTSPFTLTGYLKPGLPDFQFPNMTLEHGNITVTTQEIFQKISIGVIIVPLVSILESVAIGKNLARRGRYRIDANQEIVALGFANFLSAFVSAFPITASFSRSMVNHQTGAKSPAGGIVTGGIVILALATLTPYFYYIPSAALAAVIITAVINMVEFEIVKELWKSKKLDLLPFFTTFILSIFLGLEIGIVTGIGLSIVMILVSSARPTIVVKHEKMDDAVQTFSSDDGHLKHQDIVILQPNQGLNFSAVEMLHDRIVDVAYEDRSCSGVVLDFTHVSNIDFTGVHSIHTWYIDLNSRNIHLIFACTQDDIGRVLRNSEIFGFQSASTVDEAIQMIREDSLLESHGLPETEITNINDDDLKNGKQSEVRLHDSETSENVV